MVVLHVLAIRHLDAVAQPLLAAPSLTG